MQFSFDGQTNFYRGKVRDVYTIQNQWLVMVVSNRISAFDVILPREIPYKGQVLNQLAVFMLHATGDICKNWLLHSPAPNVSVGKKCIPFKVEVVVRGNLCGHAWRTYKSGKRELCGVVMPDGLKENDFFHKPIITPSTKADTGHDEDISVDEIINSNLATADEWNMIQNYALQLFERGNMLADKQGLILADTKYEFGKIGGQIYLMDEIHTPDSSRYFYKEGFYEKQKNGKKQKQLSKEFVREWLLQNDFSGQAHQSVPEMSDDWVQSISDRYIELYEKITGEAFIKSNLTEQQTFHSTAEYLKTLG